MQKLLAFGIAGLMSFQYVFASLEKEFIQALSSPTEWSKQKEKLNKALNDKEINVNELELMGKTFDGFDFSGMNFQNFNFSPTNLRKAQLEWVDLTETNRKESNLREANLKHTSLVNAHLENKNLWITYFDKANLTGAKLTNANLDWTSFEEANLTNVNLKEAKSVENANFSKARLSKDYVLPEKCSTQVLEKLYNDCQDEKIKPILKYLASNIKIDDSYFENYVRVVEEDSSNQETKA